MKRTSLFKLVFLSLLIVLSSALTHAQVTAIKAGKVLDPETGTITANQIILVEGQTIKAIGPDIKIPDGALAIDLSNRTVLPGLFDAHTHLCMTTRRARHGGTITSPLWSIQTLIVPFKVWQTLAQCLRRDLLPYVT